ncbi:MULTISPECIES: cell division protein FtsN [Citrobacter freundii complex]|uniref:cell division protein FtsN n=1 Tax=Citrobacter freundii complex TaxID=1344959 RepID=UPI0008FFD726|nr:cell division protein FtsN [Citrobacter portucalensis]MBD9987175.1 cell division protein FtsN [Citrobacter portucalensis]MBE0034856.1 cell division protein FtsN [Citrobacter portucalensis]MBE0040049.1 cell division protein FtsN [Citrobacter portucalensis]MBE0045538.1 cell division protein FtsN [Citrobacter portucalensis]MBE0078844.1 cell division protein FtsN [Citrobacter portucalensis]
MAQRDYVRRGQPAPSRRKKSTSRKKQRNTPAVSPAMVAIAAAVLVTFIGGLYFITHHKKEESETLQNQKVTGNGIPPKPEERWRYIKELESRQPGVRAPTEPSAGGEVLNADQLTNEQRQLLAQMQADMRQQPTQLNEVPWNEQTPEQRQQTLQRQRQVQQQQWNNAQQQAQQPRPRATEQPYQQQQTRTAQAAPVQQPKAQPKPAAQQPYQDLLQTPAHTTAAQPKPQPAAPITNETQPPKQTAEKKDERRWMVQCGSFKGAEQAETVRAQLAFEGFNSRITTNNGWNRVVIGPVKGKENADNTISRLKVAGHTNCIRLSTGG